jgi:hypothetical protein
MNFVQILSIVFLFFLVGCGDEEKSSSSKSSSGGSSNAPPRAVDVAIAGDNFVGGFLQVKYNYRDPENDAEGYSTIQWYRDGVAIDGGTRQRYQIRPNDLNKKITATVVPVASTGAKSGERVQSANSMAVISYDLDFTITASCSHFINGVSVSGPYKFEISHLDNKGSFKELLLTLDSGWSYNIFIYEPTRPGLTNNYNEFLKNKLKGSDGYLLLKCVYANYQTSIDDAHTLLIPLHYDLWKATEPAGVIRDPVTGDFSKQAYINSKYYDVNLISSIHSEIILGLLKAGQTYNIAKNYASKIIDSAYPGAIYKDNPKADFANYEKMNATFSDTSLQFDYYRSISADIKAVSNGKPVPFIEAVVSESVSSFENENARCKVAFICARFLPWKNKHLVQNYDFSDNAKGWNITKNYQNNSTLRAEHLIDKNSGVFYLELKTDYKSSDQVSFAEINQEVTISNQSKVQNLFLNVSYESLTAGCGAGFGCFSSGAAGYFMCLRKAATGRRYCLFYAAYTDSIILGNVVGNLFNPKSTDRYALIKIAQPSKQMLLQIDKAFSEYHKGVTVESGDVILVGAIATEFQGSQKDCTACFSSIGAKRIDLFEVH